MRVVAWLVAFALLPIVAPLGEARGPPATARVYDEAGRLVWEFGVASEGVAYARHHHHARDAARPGGGGGGDLTDCGSDAYRLAGWRWRAPYAVATTAHAPQVAAALATWDAATGAALAGNVTVGLLGAAGTYDGANQIDWVDLGATTTIAVTTTWYSRFTGEALESDGQYNTRYAWATDGRSSAMDAQNILAHEIGHTLGLDHPRGKTISCLTMYAYGSEGETQKRTLGDGDLLGIRAIYGA